MAADQDLEIDENISSKSHSLKIGLRNLICLLEEKEATSGVVVYSVSVSDVLDRFMLWCGNLGALHKPTKTISLDQRLAGAPEVRDQILVNIADLNEAIEDREFKHPMFYPSTYKGAVSGIIFGDSPNREIPPDDDESDDPGNDEDGAALHDRDRHGLDASDAPMDEAHMNLELMAEAMKSLFRLGVLVRRSGPQDRFQRALQQSTFVFPATFDTNYVEQKYPKLYNVEDRWLSKRLGSANAKRRQFMKYCREHKARLDAYDDETPILRDGATEKLSSKATTFIHNVEQQSPEPASGDDDDAISIMTATTTFNAATKLKLPSLAELSSGADHFECPICFTLQSSTTEKAWKIHAFRDLKTYVCTVGGRECNSLLFGDRNAWFEHELQNHRSRYNCPFCDQKGFRSKDTVTTHISSTHGAFTRDQLSALADASCLVPTQFRARDCPFCDDWAAVLEQKKSHKGKEADDGAIQDAFVSATKFKRHVGTHQEQMAIFVIPKSSDTDADKGLGSDSDAVASEASFQSSLRDFIDVTESAYEAEFDSPLEPNYTEDLEKSNAYEGSGPKPADTVPPKDSGEDPFHFWGSFSSSKTYGDGTVPIAKYIAQIARDEAAIHRSSTSKNHEKPTRVPPRSEDASDVDSLFIKHKSRTLTINFRAGKIDDGSVHVGDIRNKIMLALDPSEIDHNYLKMYYKGRLLRGDKNPARDYGIKNNSEIHLTMSGSTESSDDSDESTREIKTVKRPKYPSPEPEPSEPAEPPAMKKLAEIERAFEDELRPMCRQFSASPPSDPQKLEDEHRRISQAMTDHILLINEIKTEGFFEAREKKKQLINLLAKTSMACDVVLENSNRRKRNNEI
ncbi:hypothetical protein SLS62_000476 [Diatrype stigma]|uniref:Ubiquitin-like domain-containing protein n=1 Tax=Diatrype stigma TaxID=117547 RepID=A0AAN9YUH4_9PEZI